MGRREKDRIVHQPPLFKEFKPVGLAGKFLEEVFMSLDEYEAIRLVDYKQLSHEESADEMGISRPVFTKLLEKARYKFSKMLVEGAMLKIEGGNIHFKRNVLRCTNCKHLFVIEIEKEVEKCPNCGSDNIINIAGGFGHGRCCINNKQGRQ